MRAEAGKAGLPEGPPPKGRRRGLGLGGAARAIARPTILAGAGVFAAHVLQQVLRG